MDYEPQVETLADALKSAGVLSPRTLANEVVGLLADGPGLLVMPRTFPNRIIPLEPEGDPELSAMVAMVAAMDSLPDEGDVTMSGAPWRALQYLAGRYGFVLCTAD